MMINIARNTLETQIDLILNLAGSGNYNINTGIGFFDHMLCQVAKHGQMDLTVDCRGDLEVDGHHTVEDVGICLGQALQKATVDMTGMARYGWAESPMDEALSKIVIDLSGRSYLHFDVTFSREKVGEFELELCREFFRAVVDQAKINLHIVNYYGLNNHHIAESIFKGFGRALNMATTYCATQVGILTTKGQLGV